MPMKARFLFIPLLCALMMVFPPAGLKAAQSIQPPAGMAPEPARVKHIQVLKSERRMELLDQYGNVVRSYRIALGKNPVGHKEFEGDNRTPEGSYTIDARNPNSDYFLSLRVSYPSKSDRQRAKKNGLKPGGDIFIHGQPNGKSWMWWKYSTKRDWTNGCIALVDKDMKELWDLISDKTPIDIKP
jgi:murein L,D-transpeptidase YafK